MRDACKRAGLELRDKPESLLMGLVRGVTHGSGVGQQVPQVGWALQTSGDSCFGSRIICVHQLSRALSTAAKVMPAGVAVLVMSAGARGRCLVGQALAGGHLCTRGGVDGG